ncbi:uncharacterized protein N7500_004976 [Penicillium coprophilum]|uniref:uncharacterized protein n=1 Tax=Penicillium coprophilum TaxID=36646 RepID=UPI00238A0817|nr:uncharacterized protein N7500_004976 [Penicillium coprophilum]KAJ5163146.1 hypothetical protein N7500_004976 [Penicillium coprophilum]
MDAANDQVARPSLPLDVVAHNTTVILSGVLLGALLAFVASHLGWLRHHVHLNDRLVNAIFPLGPQFFFFTLPLWFIVASDVKATSLTYPAFIREYSTAIYQSDGHPEYNAIEITPAQMTETPDVDKVELCTVTVFQIMQ